MEDPVVTPAPPVTPAPAAVTPAPVTPAPVTPAPAATPEAPKTLLETAKVGEVEAPDALVKAVEDWQKNPTPENKAIADKALVDAKAAIAADKKSKEDAKAANVVPEKYDIKDFKAPEGVTLDQAALDAFTPVAKALGLKADGVQKLLDFQAAQQKAVAEAGQKAWDSMMTAKMDEAKKELGAKFEEELSFAAKYRDTCFSKKTIELINQTPLANDINFLRDMIAAGRKLSPEKIIEGGAGPEGDPTKSAAAAMFPSMSK